MTTRRPVMIFSIVFTVSGQGSSQLPRLREWGAKLEYMGVVSWVEKGIARYTQG